jgi:cadmium resistance protein CadD (predicted permease)
MIIWVFFAFLVVHVATGVAGLVSFWVPVLGRKGAAAHRRWGRFFYNCLLVTATMAVGMSLCSLYAPLETHPKLDDAGLVRGLFGWMMLYLAILTVSLCWHGLESVRNKLRHAANRSLANVGLQLVVIVAALNCAWQGWLIGQFLMMAISLVGIASGLTNLSFAFKASPGRSDYLKEHVKALVGAGISVYTAFLAFGAVRFMPHNAFDPTMWAVPLFLGILLIVYHQFQIDRKAKRTRLSAAAPAR